jgi:predicted AlkP superfamily pyrophosphatase or phosphodiesterase
MPRLRRLRLTVALALGGALVVAIRAWPVPEARGAGAPRLVLFVSVDQMRFDYLTRFEPLYKEGLRTLVDRGAVFTNARYRHANTETGPGHSVLLSGRSPRHSGIVANRWFDRAQNREVNVVDDPAAWSVGGPGRRASPVNFEGFTVGDVLKRRTPGSRVVGVSMKDRSAILLAGPKADAAYWFENAAAGFITSSHYMSAAPAWLDRWNARRLVDGHVGAVWQRLLADEAVYRKYAGEDDVKGEWDNRRTVFPHILDGTPPTPLYYEDLRRTPFADELVLGVALEALAGHDLGTDGDTDLLAVGFSGTDSIGHTYGPDSQEIMDQLLRLDRTLGRLLEAVDARAGLSRTVVLLSADHGAHSLVEVLQARGLPARRARPDDIRGPVARAFEARFGKDNGLIASFMTPDFYLDRAAVERTGVGRREVEAVAEKALLDTGLVHRVYTHERILGPPPADDPYFPLVRRSFFAARSPDLYVVQKQWTYIDDRVGGTGHGTPYDDDRHVPVVFMGPGVRPGRYDQACGPEDMAPTLAMLLGLDYPQQDAERLLTELSASPAGR